MKLASIEIIKEVKKHSNADSLDLATILGWQSVIKRGEYKAGDKVVFVVVDTILPRAPWSEFLVDKKNPEKPIRLNTVKLRGEYSSGLVLPLSILPENVQGWQEGADVGGFLEIKKYEKEISASLSGEVVCVFPTYLAPMTDEDNGLSNPEIVDLVLKSDEITVTQKLDGSSATLIIENGEIKHVCSRRLSLKETSSNAFWYAARKLTIPEGFTGIIQGELMGPGIQGNQLELKEPTLYVYQIKQDHSYLTYDEMLNLCVQVLNSKCVPLNFCGSPKEFCDGDYKKMQNHADGMKFENGKLMEGIVVRPKSYQQSGNGRPLGFKLVNRNYKD